jgi:hypothetical protein
MLNEKVDFNNVYWIASLAGIAFLSINGFGFIYFAKLKKRDEEKRRNFKEVVNDIDSLDRP